MRIHNTGTRHSLIIVSATSSDPADYAVSGSGTCGALPATVEPGKDCTLGVAFNPGAAGARGATLTLTDNSTSSRHKVQLSGAGIAGLTTSKVSLLFGSVKFGDKSSLSFSVTNHQAGQVMLHENFDGANSADFSITGGTCTSPVGAGKSCTITLTFKPGALGTESATVSIADSPDPLSPYAVALSTGPTIAATVAPTSIAFGRSRTSSKTLNVTVTNLSQFSLPLSESFSGTHAGNFAVSGGTCGATALPGASCTIAVTFTPTRGRAAERASMDVDVGNDPESPHKIELTGSSD